MMANYSMCKCSPLLICTSLGGGATAPIFAKTTQLTFRSELHLRPPPCLRLHPSLTYSFRHLNWNIHLNTHHSGASKLRKCGFIVMISTKRNLGLSTLYIPNVLCSACPGIVEICLQLTPNDIYAGSQQFWIL